MVYLLAADALEIVAQGSREFIIALIGLTFLVVGLTLFVLSLTGKIWIVFDISVLPPRKQGLVGFVGVLLMLAGFFLVWLFWQQPTPITQPPNPTPTLTVSEVALPPPSTAGTQTPLSVIPTPSSVAPIPTPKPPARYTPQQVVERYYALIVNSATRSDARELIGKDLQEQQNSSNANTRSFWEDIEDLDIDVRNTRFESDTSVRVSTFIRYHPYGKAAVCEIRELTVNRDEETNQWLINDPGDSNAKSQYDPNVNCN